MSKASLEGVVLNTAAPERLARFYTEHLGMILTQTENEWRLGYDPCGTYLALRQSPSSQIYQHDPHDRFWKIGITLPDVDAAYRQLIAKDITITEPRQFQDIGYLCHITDPEGFQIELLQHTFEGRAKTALGDPDLPLGGGARLGQITLRTTDIERELAHFQNDMGMTLLSIQPVRDYGFDLYFLAFTHEEPPDADLTSVKNREWLWQRPYTTLEIQHRLGADTIIQPPSPEQAGYAGIRFTVDGDMKAFPVQTQ